MCSWYMPHVITPALVGLAINYTLLVPIYLNWVVKFVSDVEMYMASVERIVHFIKMSPENYKVNGIRKQIILHLILNYHTFFCNYRLFKNSGFVPQRWPLRGEIRFEGVTLRYDHSHEVAVSSITLHITPGQKVFIKIKFEAENLRDGKLLIKYTSSYLCIEVTIIYYSFF